jgi:ABC-2 type transport system permease protein
VTGQGGAPASVPEAARGSIYDLGYQRYEGARLGRRGAVFALYADSLRACFGLGRPGRAKVVPIGLTVLVLLPAVIGVAIEATVKGAIQSPIRYDNYFSTIVTFLVLFVAAQGPELLGRDQRYRSLSLFFSRALERMDYPAAKILALTSALLIVSILPQAAIFLGKILGATDLVAALRDNLKQVPPILLSSLSAAFLMAVLALAVAAFTPRRAYATAGIFALFFISTAVASIVAETAQETSGGSFGQYAPLLAPVFILEGLTGWLFGTVPQDSVFEAAGRPELSYLVVAAGLAVAAIALVVWRYRRIPL